MPSYNIPLPGRPRNAFAQGAQSLAEIFKPDYAGQIQARQAAAGIERDHAATALSLGQRDKVAQETAGLQATSTAQEAIRAALAGNPNWQSDPALRAQILGNTVIGADAKDLPGLLNTSAAYNISGTEDFGDRDLARVTGAGGTNAASSLYGFETDQATQRYDIDQDLVGRKYTANAAAAASRYGADQRTRSAIAVAQLGSQADREAYANEIVNVQTRNGVVSVTRREAHAAGAPIIGEKATPEQIAQGNLTPADRELLALGQTDPSAADIVDVRNEDGTITSKPAWQLEPGERQVLSETDVKGGIVEGLPEDQQTRIVQGKPTGSNYGYRHPETGEVVTGVTHDAGLTDARTGEPLPQDAQLIDRRVQGPSAAGNLSKAPTERESKDTQFLDRMQLGDYDLQDAMYRGEGIPDFIPNAVEYWASMPHENALTTIWLNGFVDERTKAFANGAQLFLTAILRKDSGAAVPISEYSSYYIQFIPLPGDTPAILEKKRRARHIAKASIRKSLSAEQILLRAREGVGGLPASAQAVDIINENRRRIAEKHASTPGGLGQQSRGQAQMQRINQALGNQP